MVLTGGAQAAPRPVATRQRSTVLMAGGLALQRQQANDKTTTLSNGRRISCLLRQLRSMITLQKAKSIARHLGITLRKVRSGDYRVNFRDGNETTAYYTGDLEDAVNAAVEMARKRNTAD
jgi:hypothetical protein